MILQERKSASYFCREFFVPTAPINNEVERGVNGILSCKGTSTARNQRKKNRHMRNTGWAKLDVVVSFAAKK